MVVMSIGCSRKAVPTIYIPSVKVDNRCDSLIQKLIDSIRTTVSVPFQSDLDDVFGEDIPEVVVEKIIVDTNDVCSYYKLSALEMAKKYNDIGQQLQQSKKETEFYKALAQSQARKIINNNYINSKNKNTQIGDGNVLQEKNKGPAVNGDGNVIPIKPTQSAIGDGNKLDNRSKDRFWLGVLVASGVIIGLYTGWQIIKRYLPGFLPVRLLVGIISKFKL